MKVMIVVEIPGRSKDAETQAGGGEDHFDLVRPRPVAGIEHLRMERSRGSSARVVTRRRPRRSSTS
jgi:hypothetical protein